MTREEMLETANYWLAESKRDNLSPVHRAMARRQAKSWCEKANNPVLVESYIESGTDEEFQDRMNCEVRF